MPEGKNPPQRETSAQESLINKRLPSKVTKELLENWIPQLEQLKKDRRFVKYFLISIMGAPALAVIILVGKMLFFGESLTAANGIFGFGMTGIAAFSFTHIGKLQACDDAMHIIKASLISGNAALFFKGVESLTCYAGFGGAINDAAKLAKRSGNDHEGVS